MTQKLISKEKSVRDLLQTIEPKGIAEESMRQTVEVLQFAYRLDKAPMESLSHSCIGVFSFSHWPASQPP
jgi:hypothetical protein